MMERQTGNNREAVAQRLVGLAEAPRNTGTPEATNQPERIGPTSVTYIRVSGILSKATGFISSYDYTLNPYGGCSFGCSYCYAAFFTQQGDAGKTWGRWVNVKENAIRMLIIASRKGIRGKSIYCSTVTDPYQPIERQTDLTGQLLDMLGRSRVRLVIQTRSPLVTRDIHRFKEIEKQGGRVQVNMTVTTDDDAIRQAFEPGCPSNTARLRAVQELAGADVQCCVTVTPALLVTEPEAFATALEQSGAASFIVQPFHHDGRAQFVAGTRTDAIKTLAERLETSSAAVRTAYQKRYSRLESVLRHELGERLRHGREGFRPPF